MKKTKSGISLIVLVITILVLSILAATVIISISNTNVIEETNKTVFKSDLLNYKEVFEMYVTTETMKDNSFDSSSLDGTYKTNEETFKKIFGEVSEKYQDGLAIQDGKLVYETEDETEKAIVDSLGMGVTTSSSSLVTYTSEGVPIPSGFYEVGGTKTTGLVISDDASDENRGVGENDVCVGNQFVWIPVDYTIEEGETPTEYTYTYTNDAGTSETKTAYLYKSFTDVFKRGSADSTTNDMTGTLDTTTYTEPYSYNGATGYTNESAEYYAMMESVQKYGGFYIARFEAGDGDATEGTNGVTKGARTTITTAHTVVSKKGAYVYNYVPWGESMTSIAAFTKNNVENVAGAVYLSQQMYAESSSVVSTLCYGVQWDATMNFVADAEHSITDSRSWGNYSNSTGDAATNSGTSNMNYTTGRNEAWKAKNIYDLAGNVYEWTMEANSSYSRVARGGYYSGGGSDYPASIRYYSSPYYSSVIFGFRPTLYIVVE